MLVLKRRVNEVILIGVDIRIVVLGIEGTKVKIGIDAPDIVKVVREELVKEALHVDTSKD